MSEESKSEKIVREIKRQTRRKYSSEEKIRIVLEGLRGESSIAEICRKACLPPGRKVSIPMCTISGVKTF